MSILKNNFPFLFLFLFLFLSLQSSALSAEPSIKVSFKPDKIKQGDILYLTVYPVRKKALQLSNGVKASPGAYRIEGTFLNKPIPFYENSNKEKAALIGIDMNTEPGVYTLSITFEDEKGKRLKKNYKIRIRDAKFGVQKLTLPKEMVELDEETLKRVRMEQEKIKNVWNIFTEDYLWEGNFLRPVNGELTSNFGLKRIINGERRNPHNGIDFAAPEGTPVYAPNNGRVVFIDEQFFSGKSLIIDHGRELFSMYFHLSEIVVKDGEEIKKGLLIAKVGKSGRATGPHLHWGMRLNGARVNPISLVNLPLE